ncbi:hypothetical protein [Polyangium mundeleinium]|uniref:Uncharacterized protein n=1 Tax=Polyangium mundeleinium TaxID=2995306 RepID=A0ABT5EQ02_9BACT|nr:hypothetical protein [Polyangium mundeleinium]MDC0743437.1 hypothetical protein [Polyangium mundeleinium]
MKTSAPSREALAALEGKYAEIAALRRARDRGEPLPARAVFKALAERFPGALHELDTLPLDVVDARLAALQAALAGGVIEPWMAWMASYHALLRAGLHIRIRTTKDRARGGERASELAAEASAHAGIEIDVTFVHAMLRPPKGRLVGVVYARLEALFGEPAASIRATLFPRLRDRRAPETSGVDEA